MEERLDAESIERLRRELKKYDAGYAFLPSVIDVERLLLAYDRLSRAAKASDLRESKERRVPGFDELWFNKADAMRHDTNVIVTTALRKAGWKHTSQTPGSYWRWQKEIGGCVYSVDQEEASRLQEQIDRTAYFKQYPNELGD